MRLPPSQQSITPDKLAEKTVTNQSTQEIVGSQQRQRETPSQEDVDKMDKLLHKKDNEKQERMTKKESNQKTTQKPRKML